MSDFVFCELADRAVLQISGDDRADFLQNLITNDIHALRAAEMIYALLLTPQGKFLFDFFISEDGNGGFLVDLQKSQLDALVKKLTLYRLRAQVEFVRKENLKVWFIWTPQEGKTFTQKNSFRDPRHAALGWRMISATKPQDIQPAKSEDYHLHRITLGVPEAGHELTAQRFPLECNLDRLHAIDFNKGCYIGQEVTSRLHRRADGGRRRLAIIKKIVKSHQELAVGAAVLVEGREVGQLLSAQGDIGLAIIRRDRLNEAKPPAEPLINGQPITLDFMV